MNTPADTPIPSDDEARVAALHSYGIIDTPADPAYDAFATLAAGICDTPMALVSLVDASRNWLKASIGFAGVREFPRELSMCTHAVASGKMLEIPDTSLDERFRDNPVVTGGPNIRFYAGAPLIDRDGHVLGTVCAMDRLPRELTAEQRDSLTSLAKVVVTFIESRKGVAPRTLDQVSLLSGALESAPDPIVLLRIAKADNSGSSCSPIVRSSISSAMASGSCSDRPSRCCTDRTPISRASRVSKRRQPPAKPVRKSSS
jgi:hypothetical protein